MCRRELVHPPSDCLAQPGLRLESPIHLQERVVDPHSLVVEDRSNDTEPFVDEFGQSSVLGRRILIEGQRIGWVSASGPRWLDLWTWIHCFSWTVTFSSLDADVQGCKQSPCKTRMLRWTAIA